jgi:hypothetical protein
MNTTLVKSEIDKYKTGDTSNAAFVWRVACLHYWIKNFN